jgi:hypothetical protein
MIAGFVLVALLLRCLFSMTLAATQSVSGQRLKVQQDLALLVLELLSLLRDVGLRILEQVGKVLEKTFQIVTRRIQFA